LKFSECFWHFVTFWGIELRGVVSLELGTSFYCVVFGMMISYGGDGWSFQPDGDHKAATKLKPVSFTR